jgi:hypothetical protein
MKQFILVYYGQPKHASAEEAKAGYEAWKKWAADLGNKLTVPGAPAKPGKVVTASGVTDADPDTGLSGYTIFEADSMDEAIEVTKKCPHVTDGATMAVHELVEMPM